MPRSPCETVTNAHAAVPVSQEFLLRRPWGASRPVGLQRAVAVKSGPNWGNADQHKRQSTNFDALRKRLYKLNKQFDPLVGQAYGQQCSEPTDNSRFRRRSGQAFWQEITDDTDFYLKSIRLMKDVPRRNRPKFRAEWDQAVNRYTRDFMKEFCRPDGSIDWEKLVAFNSALKPPKRKRK
jgi:hypothetical protein